MNISRRSLLTAAAGGVFATALPAPIIRRASAAGRNVFVFGGTDPMTGNWDPTSHTQLTQWYMECLVFGRLFSAPMRPEDPSKIVWSLATGQKLIDDYTLEYTLRDGVTFHNGAPFSAEDVKATFEYATNPSRPASAIYPGQCEVEVVDRLTARIHTKKFGYPASAFQFTGADLMRIMSKDDIKDPKVLSQRPNGTGPFKFVKQEGDTTSLEANDKYFEGRPKLDEVRFRYIADGTTRVLELMSGDIDLIQRLEPEQYATVKENKALQVWQTAATENKYLHFRCNKPPFDNPLIRQAAAHAIDRSQILAVMDAAGTANNDYLDRLKFGYEDLPNFPDFSPEKCQALLAKAGFPKGQGLPELEYITSTGVYPKTKEYGEVIASMLQEQGFNVQLNVMDPASWATRLYQQAGKVPDGHMIDCGWNVGTPEPDIVLRAMFHSKAGPEGGLINGIKDKDIDAALDAERGETDLAKRKLLIGKATEVIASKVPSLPLFTSVNLNAARVGLTDFYVYPSGEMDLARASYKDV
ncbi:MAG TPA: ABC transporter substrate-binding protein [Nitrospira sp.]|nr:ABC transporter substrate-binding protein [Nitrospira sp.]